jgi:hypothetical protein
MVFLLYAIFSITGSDSNIFLVFKYFTIDSKKTAFAYVSDYFSVTVKSIQMMFAVLYTLFLRPTYPEFYILYILHLMM